MLGWVGLCRIARVPERPHSHHRQVRIDSTMKISYREVTRAGLSAEHRAVVYR